MKKNILLAGIILCMAACHSESADLRLFDLKGNVESVSLCRYMADSLGNRDDFYDNYNCEHPEVIMFDDSGRIAKRFEQVMQIHRNSAGNIIYIDLPWEGDDFGFAASYEWDKFGHLKSYRYTDCYGIIVEREILYDWQHKMTGAKVVEKVREEGCQDFVQYQGVVQFKNLESDSYGNWTKRLEKCVYTEFNENNNAIGPTKTSYKLSERTITYYEKSH